MTVSSDCVIESFFHLVWSLMSSLRIRCVIYCYNFDELLAAIFDAMRSKNSEQVFWEFLIDENCRWLDLQIICVSIQLSDLNLASSMNSYAYDF